VSSESEVLLRVRRLETRFARDGEVVRAVNGVSFDVHRGEVLALVGESGCGKSATVMSLLRLLPARAAVRADEISFDGQDLLALDEKRMRQIRGSNIGVVFQEPTASLNPVLTIGRQITESLEVHRKMSPDDAQRRACELLRLVGIPSPESRLDDYPHEFSGGMCQRVMIAMALSCEPSLLIADEPTTALDVTIQAQILDLVAGLRASRRMALIWITHDLRVVSALADSVVVMYAGSIVERAPVRDLFERPQHPYTRGLLASIPKLHGERANRLTVVPGQPPDMTREPSGCSFVERCPHAFSRCDGEPPELAKTGDSHYVACFWDTERGRER
jgi:peptide/nickel transport system ATP-binding protein/oligopeptide transport system ATP-binding protein